MLLSQKLKTVAWKTGTDGSSVTFRYEPSGNQLKAPLVIIPYLQTFFKGRQYTLHQTIQVVKAPCYFAQVKIAPFIDNKKITLVSYLCHASPSALNLLSVKFLVQFGNVCFGNMSICYILSPYLLWNTLSASFIGFNVFFTVWFPVDLSRLLLNIETILGDPHRPEVSAVWSYCQSWFCDRYRPWKIRWMTRKECFTAGRDLINRQIRYLRARSKCVYVG